MQPDEQLVRIAIEASQKAYAPYSGFPVGAAIRAGDGKIYPGCNIENAAYPVSSCAEASAISAMISAGQQQIEAIAVVGPGDALVTPCGACRQRIREFASANTPVYIAGPEGWRATFTLDELLPHSFGPENLE